LNDLNYERRTQRNASEPDATIYDYFRNKYPLRP